jgi:hypothetical protein
MSERERELLTRAGIHVAVLDEIGGNAAVRRQCIRAAQTIRKRGFRKVGLLPASADVSVVGIGVNLAIAMAELTGSTVAYIDANLRWPALAPLLNGDKGGEAPEPGQMFATRWLNGDVALLVPQERAVTSAGLGELGKLLASSSEIFGASLVDLTGWRRVGEHLSAYDILDGVAVVAQTDVTTEDQLLRLGHELPVDRYLGVLLLGAHE